MDTTTPREWKDVVGYAGHYLVSDAGQVMSFKRSRSGRLVAQCVKSCGYSSVKLHQDKVQQNLSVSRLVAQAFIPNPEGLPEVDHINRDRRDNSVANLRWVNHSQNMQNRCCAAATGLRGVVWHPSNRYICKIGKDGRTHHIGYFKDAQEAARAYDVKAREMYGPYAAVNAPPGSCPCCAAP
jgi:hypothetical protein